MNPVRRLLIAILTVGSAGLALSAIFGDLFSLLLIVQAQPWRVTWLLAAGAAMSFAISAEPLWKGGWPSRLTLALLVCAWAMDGTDVGALLAVASWLLSVSSSRIEPRISESAIRSLCLAAAALVTAKIVTDIYHVTAYALRLPADAQPPLILRLLDAHVFSEIAAILIVAFIAVPHFRVGATVASIRNVAICVFAIWFWREEWDPHRSLITRSGEQKALTQILASRQGSILWLGGNQETWYWARRPNWVALIQFSGIVFSRDLTELWYERMQALRDLGWVADIGTVPLRLTKPDPAFPDISTEKVQRFCSRMDAPAWLIAPIQDANAFNDGYIWRAPVRRYVFDSSRAAEIGVDLYAVLPCAPA